MLNAFKTHKFKDDEVVIAWQSFAVDGVHETIVRGQRLRGSHPAVKKAPDYFVPDATPESEWPSHFAGAVESSMRLAQEQQAERARHAPPEIPLAEQVLCVAGFTKSGRSFREGGIYRRDDPAVNDPETRKYFAEPARPLV